MRSTRFQLPTFQNRILSILWWNWVDITGYDRQWQGGVKVGSCKMCFLQFNISVQFRNSPIWATQKIKWFHENMHFMQISCILLHFHEDMQIFINVLCKLVAFPWKSIHFHENLSILCKLLSFFCISMKIHAFHAFSKTRKMRESQSFWFGLISK